MIQYLIQTLITPFSKKKLFGKKYILFKDYYNQSSILSIYCLTLGYIYKDKIEILIKLLGNSQAELKTQIDGLSEMAELIKKDVNNETKNVHNLFVDTTIKLHFEMFYKDQNLDYKNVNDLLKICNNKIPLGLVISLSELHVFSLISFGYKYPELTEQLLTNKTDDAYHNLAIKSGLDIPKEKIELDIEEYKNLTKELIIPFITKYHSDLISSLD